MRALRILLIVVVVLGGLFVAADRLAVNFAEGEVADRLKTTENLAATPDVSINGFPFLTQLAGSTLDDVEVGIKDYEAAAGDGERIRIDDLTANMKGVEFSGDYSSATAASATGTATIAYDELLKAAKSEPTEVAPGITARVVGLSDGGNGKIKVGLEVDAPVIGTRQMSVLSTVSVKGDTVEVRTDSLPDLAGLDLAEDSVREITDFQQAIDDLPGGVQLDKVEAAPNGVEISVQGSNVQLAG
ncbi:LmeA family phospholipid-binding protein [Streptomyces sp. NPDC000851]